MRKVVVAIALAAGLCAQRWPAPKDAQDSYDWLQAKRDEARKLWTANDPKGIAILNDALEYMDQPLVRDLAAGRLELASRRTNMLMDLAEAYALRSEPEPMWKALRDAAELTPAPAIAKYLESRPAFAPYRSSAEFQKATAAFRRYEGFWDSKALATPFRAELSEAERVAGLSKLWSEVKYNFGFPEKLMRLRWDELYVEWIPKVLAAKGTAEYYKVLAQLCAKLEDGHTNVYSPDQIDDGSKPPMRTAKVGDRVFILEVRSPSLESQGIRAGMEILKVDGMPAVAYATREIEPYISASTPQDRELRTYTYGFLRGPKATPVRLMLRAPDGTESERTLARSGYKDVRSTPQFSWEMLPGDVAWIRVNGFDSSNISEQFVKEFPKIRTAKAVILDLRQNGGGSSGVGYEFLARFIQTPVKGSRQVMRRYNPTDRAHGMLLDFVESPAGEIAPAEGPRFEGPVAVLTGAATFSAAEDFLVAWKNSGRGPTIGSASGGSTGQPLGFPLPGGGSARVCTKHDTFPDGREWVGVGIAPDIPVELTAADVMAGKDAVLDRAVAFVKSGR